MLRGFFVDMKKDVENECKQFGTVSNIMIEEGAPFGTAFVLFNTHSQAIKCIENGRRITANIDERQFQTQQKAGRWSRRLARDCPASQEGR